MKHNRQRGWQGGDYTVGGGTGIGLLHDNLFEM
jgi:hypothetical protein